MERDFLIVDKVKNDFADERDPLRTAHFCTPTAYKNALSARKVFFPTYTPPEKTDSNLFSACGPKMMSALSTVSFFDFNGNIFRRYALFPEEVAGHAGFSASR